MATKLFKKNGYGQVEPTHLSAQKTGQIFSTKVNETVSVLENGAFLKLDGTTSGAGEFLLVFNEIKNYRSDEIGYKDFAIKKNQQLNNEIYTRLFKVNDNDYFVTNMIKFDNITGDATHATVTNPTTKYFEVKREKDDNVIFHSLYYEKSNKDFPNKYISKEFNFVTSGIKIKSDNYFGKLNNNAILDADSKLLDEVIEKNLGD